MSDPIPLEIPPGFFGNGTPYSARGRYATGNLVRFLNGYARPIGGWSERLDTDGAPIGEIFDPTDGEAARNIISWLDRNGSAHIVVGTNLGLYEISGAGVLTDITPTGFVGGSLDSSEAVGYGVALYGAQTYGTPRSGSGFSINPASSWSFDLFGDILLAQFRNTGPLYDFDPTVDTEATAVTGPPSASQGVVVTDERIAMTINKATKLVRWSDSEDYTDWTPTVSNASGDYTITGNGDLISINMVGSEILILTTENAWIGRYTGAPFIYGFKPIGFKCGTTSPEAVAVVGNVAYWFGMGGWWTYSGGAVQKVPSEVEDWFFAFHNAPQISKMTAMVQTQFREVWWLFQSDSGSEVDSYILYHVDDRTWAYGSLDRTVGLPPVPTSTPVMVGSDGKLYNHELALAVDGEAFIETGPLELAAGAQIMGISRVYPDMKAVAQGDGGFDTNADITFLCKDSPSPDDPERSYGPYRLDRPISTLGVRGRQVRLRFNGLTRRWVAGTNRAEVVPLGER